jgi:AGCS family alanine or glycine:cation symporter
MDFSFGHFLEGFNRFFTLYLVFPSIVLLGIYLTFKLRFVQVLKLKLSFLTLLKKSDSQDEGNISHYQAVAAVLAGNFGTGNISGMAVALTTGGPGALMWMWVMAFLGSAIQFGSSLLGVKYRKKNKYGEYVGGPMYYLSEGLGLKKIAFLFSFFVILASFACGGLAQVNSMTLPFEKLGVAPWISGIVIAVFVSLVVLGGATRVAVVCSAVVPVMALLYLGTAFYILGVHFRDVLPATVEILKASLGVSSFIGGVAGYSLMKALTSGFDRAIFATDAGTGTVPLLQSGAKTSHEVIDGVVTLVAPFLVMVVCTATALVLMVTGAYPAKGLASTNIVIDAFSRVLGENLGFIIVLIALTLFGYTTTIAYATCLERAVGFMTSSKKVVKAFLLSYILFIPVGSLLHVDFVWIVADISLTAMLIINLIGVAGLSREVIESTHEYFADPIKAVETAD